MIVETTLTMNSRKKHSVRYDVSDERRASEVSGSSPKTLTALYLCNEAFDFLGQPKSIKVTIEGV